MPPILGRTLQSEDEQPGSRLVAVIGERLWRTRFNGDMQMIGRSLTLNGERHVIIGIMPQGFREIGRAQISSTVDAQIVVPLVIDPPQERRGNHTLRVIGRLRSGVSLESAREEMRAVAAALEQEFPSTNRGWGVRLATVYDTMLEPRARRSRDRRFSAYYGGR